jgi:hypothetical protein
VHSAARWEAPPLVLWHLASPTPSALAAPLDATAAGGGAGAGATPAPLPRTRPMLTAPLATTYFLPAMSGALSVGGGGGASVGGAGMGMGMDEDARALASPATGSLPLARPGTQSAATLFWKDPT